MAYVTAGNPCYASDLQKFYPEWGDLASVRAYSIGANADAEIQPQDTIADLDFKHGYIIKSFSTGSPHIIIRNLDGYPHLVNISSSTINGTYEVHKLMYRFVASSAKNTNPTSGTLISANQFNGIGVDFTSYKASINNASGSATLAANGYATYTLTGTIPSGYSALGIINWQSGHKWAVAYACTVNANGSVSISIRNHNASNAYTITPYVYVLAYKYRYDTSSAYRSRVSTNNTIYASDLNNRAYKMTYHKWQVANISIGGRDGKEVAAPANSPDSGYTSLTAVVLFNTGYKWYFPRQMAADKVYLTNNSSTAGGNQTLSVYVGDYQFT